MNHLKRKLQEIIDNIDDSICAMSATPGTSSGEASRAVKKGQEGNSQTETVSFATRAADNFRRAFPALSRPARGQIKKREQSTQKILFVRNTFTGTFCCLADNGTVTPNSKELYTLSWHGLGKKRHTFESKDGDHKYLQTELEKLFPRLKAANGKFQLYRTLGGGSGRRSLHKIPMGPQGYTINWLRENIAIGSACIYVVPLVALPQESDQSEPASSTQMPTVTCDICHEEVKLNVFENHKCKLTPSTQVSAITCNFCHQEVEPNLFEDHKCQDSDDDLLVSSFEPDDLDSLSGPPNNPPVVQVPESEVDDQPAPHIYTANKLGHEIASNKVKLKEMFPNLTDDQINEIMDGCATIEECIASILDSKEEAVVKDKPEKDIYTGLTAERILQHFRHNAVKVNQAAYPITFNRSKKKINEISRIYKNAKLDRSPVVYFVSESGDDEFEEDAADVGGPQREFFSIVMETLLTCTDPLLFEGSDGHKVPVHSQQLVLRGFYNMVGQAMAHAIVHGEFFVVGLAKPVVVFLETGCTETACACVTLDDVPNFDIRNLLGDLINMDAEQDTQLQVDDAILNLMDQCGVTAPFLTKNNATEVAYECMIYQVVHKRLAEMKQLREGLNALGLADLMDSQPKVTKELFKSVDEAAVNFGVLKHRVTKDHSVPAGSSEDQSFQFFLQYLEETCQRKPGAGLPIKDVLLFLTGSPHMPGRITVKFSTNIKDKLPDPNTCSREVVLPISHNTYEEFMRSFDSVIKIQGKGYGRA